jgi:4-amino-4-deoxy-L-arabinose transferase-like glycosyltransferase
MKYIFLIIIFVFSLLAVLPLFHAGFFPIHDNTQVSRVYEMTKALRDGMFPVRWSQDLGYGFGYPIFNFYDPFPYYVGGFIGIFGADALLSTKIMMVLGIIFSSFSMYLLAKEFWGRWGGVLSALFYIYAPYHAVDVYVRGDVAEFWAYAFLPLVFYGLWKIYKEGKWRYVVITGLSYTGIIISHNLTALMSSPFIFLFMLYLFVKVNNKKQKYYFLVSLILGILISAFYSLPTILEMNYTNVLSQIGGGASFSDHFVCLPQLWTSPWGYGGSAPGCVDGVSFMIGKYHIISAVIILILSITIIFSKKFNKNFLAEKEKLSIIIITFVGFLFSIFFTLEVSRPIWELVKPMEFIQYPWRFLIMAVFFASFIAGAIFLWINKLIKNNLAIYVLGIVLSFLIVIVSAKFFVPQKFLPNSPENYTNNYALSWTSSRISDEYMPRNFQKPKNSSEVASFSNLNSEDLKLETINQKTQEINIKYRAIKNMQILLPLAYFPSWKAFIDGNNINVYEGKKGIYVNLTQGTHNLRIIFIQTPFELLGNVVSLASILVLFIGIIYFKNKYE